MNMTAISFNDRSAVKWGAVNVSRVYAGVTMVWPLSLGLPYTMKAPLPEGTNGTVWNEWTIFGTLKPGTIAGNPGVSSFGAVPSNTSGAIHNTVIARDVTLTGHGDSHTGGFFALRARVDPARNTYYTAKYSEGRHIQILRCWNGTLTILNTVTVPFVPVATLTFTVKGSNLTATVGTNTVTATDSLVNDAGSIGFACTSVPSGINSFSAASAP